MIVFIPSAKVVVGGFKPMVILRKANGQRFGCRVSPDVFTCKQAAKDEARYRALKASAMVPDYARVA